MATLSQPGIETKAAPDMRLLLEWNTPLAAHRYKEAALGSISLHIATVLILFTLPIGSSSPAGKPVVEVDLRKSTPLVAPPFELTQRVPNRGRVSKELNLEGLLPRPPLRVPPRPESGASLTAPRPAFAVVPPPAPKPAPLPEPPKIEAPKMMAAQLPPRADMPALGSPAGVEPLPQIQTQEQPKLAFEKPGASSGTASGTQLPVGAIPVPSSSVEAAVRSAARGGAAGGLVVGDIGVGTGSEGILLPPSPGKVGSSLELLSDPQGVDFRPYLIKVLSAVRRNWFAVIPESAKLGRRGRVVIQFAIDRQGGVPKLVIAMPSGTDALDRAAVAGISASNPFPPLPAEFRGDQVRLQFNFLYNIGR